MDEKQYNTLVELIKETNERIKEAEENLGQDIRETRKGLYDEIHKLEKTLRRERATNERQHQMILRTIEERYNDLEDKTKEIEENVKTLHALSKLNTEEHEEYNRVLLANNLK